MLATDSGWGGDGGRPYLARAFSVADAAREGDGVRLDFLVQAVGPGTSRLAALEPGEGLWIHGPLGRPFSAPGDVAEGAAGAILVGGGIGVAPLAIWRRQLLAAGIPARVLLGFRDRANSGGLDLFDCSEIRLASEDGHTGHHGFVTDLLAVLLEGDDAAQRGDLRLWPTGHARGGPGDVRGARRRLRAGDGGAHGLWLRGLLRLRHPRGLPAATSVSALTARSSAATRSRRRWCRDRATRWRATAPFSRIRISQRNSVVSPSAIPSSTARGRSTQSRLDGHSAIGCWRSSRSRPSSRRRSPRSRGPAIRHRASGRRPPG